MKDKLKLVPKLNGESLEQLSDDELMLLISGDRYTPFKVLVTRHQPLVLGYATRYLGDRGLARDVTQEVFLTVWSEKKKYRPQGKFRSYLLALAINRCRPITRKQKTTYAKLSQLTHEPHEEQLPLDKLLETERATELRKTMLNLSERMRTAIILRFCNDLSYEEIASATKQAPGTVTSQVSRGLKKLYSQLCKEHRA